MTQSPASWDDLRIFLHIGRAGSLTAAAETLRVSYATVFRRLGSLEAELGVRLFVRSRAGYMRPASARVSIRRRRKACCWVSASPGALPAPVTS